VQRRGRTGRLEKGEVVVLLTKGTRDEGYHYAAQHKEKRMFRILAGMKGKLGTEIRAEMKESSTAQEPEKTLADYIPEKKDKEVKIYTDFREKGSALLKELMQLGVHIELKRLEVGDYLLSDRICVEIKKVPDFVDSIIDARLLSQMKDLRHYQKPIVIIEGEEDIYSQRRVHPNAIRGMISTIVFGFGIPVLQTKNYRETAGFLHIIARQEQFPDAKYQFHTAKPYSLQEQQEYIVSTLPGIGGTLAKPLLKKFKTVKNVFSAPEDALKEVEMIGEVKAKKIRDVLDAAYEEKKR